MQKVCKKHDGFATSGLAPTPIAFLAGFFYTFGHLKRCFYNNIKNEITNI